MHIRISLDTKFHFKKFSTLGPNFPKKVISSQKKKGTSPMNSGYSN